MKPSHLRKKERKIQRKLIRKNVRKIEFDISQEEVDFFKQYPDELEEMTSTLKAKRLFLTISTVFGFIAVGTSIFWKQHALFKEGILNTFLTDLLFEGGIALWGAALTVYLLEILLSRQYEINAAYREAVLKRIEKQKGKEGEKER